MVQYTGYVMFIWTVKMKGSSMDHLYYIYLDRSNWRRSNVTLIWTVQMDDGPIDRLCYKSHQ